jgi:hypothetical protein
LRRDRKISEDKIAEMKASVAAGEKKRGLLPDLKISHHWAANQRGDWRPMERFSYF